MPLFVVNIRKGKILLKMNFLWNQEVALSLDLKNYIYFEIT